MRRSSACNRASFHTFRKTRSSSAAATPKWPSGSSRASTSTTTCKTSTPISKCRTKTCSESLERADAGQGSGSGSERDTELQRRKVRERHVRKDAGYEPAGAHGQKGPDDAAAERCQDEQGIQSCRRLQRVRRRQ